MRKPVPNDTVPFVDRRNNAAGSVPAERDRRQFANNYDALSEDARELAMAIDQYKLDHRRRFITYEEMLAIVKELGYAKVAPTTQPVS